MRKIYKKLSTAQVEQGIIFTSTLSRERTELEGETTHEVKKDDPNKWEKIERLKNDRFFNSNPVGWRYNVIRTKDGTGYVGRGE